MIQQGSRNAGTVPGQPNKTKDKKMYGAYHFAETKVGRRHERYNSLDEAKAQAISSDTFGEIRVWTGDPLSDDDVDLVCYEYDKVFGDYRMIETATSYSEGDED